MPATKAKRAVKAKTVAKSAAAPATQSADGIVLKKAFPSQDADGLKTIRRHLRKTLRADGSFKFHKIGTRWVFPTKRDVEAARKAVAAYV